MMPELDVPTIIAGAEMHLLSSGWFDQVNRHEPKKSPGYGITCAVWLTELTPVAARSGLVSTTARLELRVRLFMAMLREPLDEIDPDMLRALDSLMRSYSGDFTLDGAVKNVDLLGETGTPLMARTGYLTIDKTAYRVADIWLPLIVNDLWEQAP